MSKRRVPHIPKGKEKDTSTMRDGVSLSGRSKQPSDQTSPNDQSRESMIKETAYFLAEKRGFVPGYELEDWIEAERVVTSYIEASPAKKSPSRRSTKQQERPQSAPLDQHS